MFLKKWDPQASVRLMQLLAQNRNARECADILNAEFGFKLTRNAILGKTFRLRLKGSLPKTAKPYKLPKPPKPEVVRSIRAITTPKFNPDAKMKSPPAGTHKYTPLPEATWKPLAGVEPVLLVSALPAHCRWPIETGNEHMGHWCCGGVKIADSPYCKTHHAVGNYPLEPKHARALRYIMKRIDRERRGRRENSYG